MTRNSVPGARWQGRRRPATSVLLFLIFCAGAAGAGLLRFYRLFRNPVVVEPPVELTVELGQSTREVAAELERRGVVRRAWTIVALARWRGVDRGVRHGLHRFAGNLTPADVLEELLRSPTPTVRVTIPEGLTFKEIARLLEQRGIASAQEYEEAVCAPDFVQLAGASPQANCAEGFLFPDTYELAPGMKAEEIARLQLERFREVINGLLARLSPSPHNALLVGLPGDQQAKPWLTDPAARAELVRRAVNLASIIEKETSRPAERPLVSSVFHNRLLRGMRLQADPTVIYGLALAGTPWNGKGLSRFLRKPAPYNTYTQAGLPPGPIANPGRGALEAALFPASTQYLFFVADGRGAHRFSRTLSEHNRAVAQLRRR